jgi:hypothetical protein
VSIVTATGGGVAREDAGVWPQGLPCRLHLHTCRLGNGLALRLGPGGVQTDEMDHFVGRARELMILDAEMQAVRAGQPRVVLVEGEAGIGKSSLLSRFVSEQRDICLLRASGDEA